MRARPPDDRCAALRGGRCAEDPARDASVDVAASALVHQFRAGPGRGVARDEARGKAGRARSFYVWDYPGAGMGFMRAFWNAAVALDPKAAELGEGAALPVLHGARPDRAVRGGGWPAATVAPIEIETRFSSFEDYWQPFTLGAGPAPGYCVSLPEDKRAALKPRLIRSVGGAGRSASSRARGR